MKTYECEWRTPSGVELVVTYYYDRHRQAWVESAKQKTSERPVKLTDDEMDRVERWIMDNRFFEDHAR